MDPRRTHIHKTVLKMMINQKQVILFICLVQGIQRINSQSDTFLLFANRPYVQRIFLNGSELLSIFESNESSVVGLDADLRMEKIFWSDINLRQIVQVDGNGSEVLLNRSTTTITSKIEGLAWDWINKKLYFTDEDRQTVEVMDPVTGYRKVLVQNSNQSQPRAIVVDPIRRWLYWSDWNRETARIVRMSMDGDGSTVLFDNETVTWPNGLALDYDTDTLYWIDGFQNNIRKSNTDGTNISLVTNLTNSNRTSVLGFGIDYFDGYLYWTDWLSDSMFRVRDGGNSELLVQLGNDPCQIHINNIQRQPLATYSNPCDNNNGGCSHLCLLSATQPLNHSCVCPDNVPPSNCMIAEDTTTIVSGLTEDTTTILTSELTTVPTETRSDGSTNSEGTGTILSNANNIRLIAIITGSIGGLIVIAIFCSLVILFIRALKLKRNYVRPKTLHVAPFRQKY